LRAALALRVDYCGFKPLEVDEIRKVVRLLVARNSASRSARPRAQRQR